MIDQSISGPFKLYIVSRSFMPFEMKLEKSVHHTSMKLSVVLIMTMCLPAAEACLSADWSEVNVPTVS